VEGARARRGGPRAAARRAVQSSPAERALNVWDYAALAAERPDAGAHGYLCAGGAGDELTLRWNVEAFTRWQLRPRVLVDVAGCTAATTVLDTELRCRWIGARAFQRVAHPDGEVGMAARRPRPEL
jgi:isopentenyl diphosphate isomerase/L-lactate dehydrogenase-like FMN-dependent dehydrogenase